MPNSNLSDELNQECVATWSACRSLRRLLWPDKTLTGHRAIARIRGGGDHPATSSGWLLGDRIPSGAVQFSWQSSAPRPTARHCRQCLTRKESEARYSIDARALSQTEYCRRNTKGFKVIVMAKRRQNLLTCRCRREL